MIMMNGMTLPAALLTGLLSLSLPPAATAQSRPAPAPGSGVSAPAGVKPAPPASTQLIQQGKSLYRAVRLKEALEKFEEALRLEEGSEGQPALYDEALGLAAVTAFRLDNQPLSRKYFDLRAALPDQKSSVRAFCYYRIALTYWREVRELVVRGGTTDKGRMVTGLTESERAGIDHLIAGGLNSVDMTLRLVEGYPEAYNIRNLLYAESALIEPDQPRADATRQLAIEALNRSIELTEQAVVAGRRIEVADFGQPTVRGGELGRTPEESPLLIDPMMKLIEGGFPTRRTSPVFPPLKPPKTEGTGPAVPASSPPPSAPASLPSTLKLEVLVSTAGEVAFARLVDGRPELGPAAILAARGWKFEPAKLNGRPVQISGFITFEVKPPKGR